MAGLSEHERAALLVTAWWSLKLLGYDLATEAQEFELKHDHGIIVSGEPKLPEPFTCVQRIESLVEAWSRTESRINIACLHRYYGVTLARVEGESHKG